MKKSKIKEGISNPKSVIKFLNGKISDEIYFYRFKNLDIENLSLEYYDESVEMLEDRFEKINGRVRGEAYSKGTISKEDAKRLKGIINHIDPKNVVETGVCNGASTLAILEGLNGLEGKLYSIDLPETPESDEENFWKGKGGFGSAT